MLFWLIVLTIGYFVVDWLRRKIKIGQITQKYVFITGCDSGFGYLLAQRLDTLGFHVIAACLTSAGMEDVKSKCSSRLHTLQLNVVSEDDINKVIQQVKSILPSNTGLWAVVNNAGIGGPIGPTECLTRKDYIDTMNVNLFGVIDVTKACLPLIRLARGRVVNIVSILGRLASVPAPYCISKYGVEAFSDVLRREVYHQGISVHILEPGYFKTNILNRESIIHRLGVALNQGSDEFKTYYGMDYSAEVMKLTDKMLNKADPNINLVVDAYEHAIVSRYPKYRYVVGTDAQLFFRFLWTVPEWLSDYIICLNMPRPQGAK